MSAFDLSEILTKTDFNNAAIPAPAPIPAENHYNRRVQRLQERVVNFFSTPKQEQSLTIRTGFLNEQDKAALISQIEGKGYGCVEENGSMVIQ